MVGFSGLASYAIFDFQSDAGRYIIDDFQGIFGTTEDPVHRTVPDGGTAGLLLSFSVAGLILARRFRIV